jgi:hypothetical protein
MISEIQVMGIFEGAEGVKAGANTVQTHQLVWMFDSQWAQQDRVHDAEDRTIGADAQGQRQHGYCGKARTLE